MHAPLPILRVVAVALLAVACANANGDALAPETVIDGYTLGRAAADCPVTNPECQKVLDLARASALLTDAGRTLVASCSLSEAECDRFIGRPRPGGGPNHAGLGEIVGLAEDAMRAEHPEVDSRSLAGFPQAPGGLAPHPRP